MPAARSLALSSSFDPNFLVKQGESPDHELGADRVTYNTSLQFQEYQEEGGIPFEGGMERVRSERERAHYGEGRIGRHKSKNRLKPSREAEGWRFSSSKLPHDVCQNCSTPRSLGSGWNKHHPRARRDTSDQSMTRSLMKQTYCPDGGASIWVLVLG